MPETRVPYSADPTPGDDSSAAGTGEAVQLTWVRQRMTRWFDPVQLIRTGIRALLASIFGAYADKREMQAALARADQAAIHDCCEDGELWVDYAADLGDGFDSTYTIAWLLGQARLPAGTAHAAPDEQRHADMLAATQRGHVLVLGGDQVYPTASRSEYENRFSGPFSAALPWLDEATRPRMFALPGNHDWYDGLTSFMRLFCQRRSVGAWKTQQTRSYFALKLPRRWWLLGIDIQLASDVDQPQLDYFTHVAENIQPGDHIILCTAQPAWVEEGDKSAAYRNLLFFERRILCPRKAKLMLTLTGDLHHYARYTDSTGERHKVTAGGGGAYLYGTQGLADAIELTKADPDEPGRGADAESKTYTRGAEYPERSVSRRLRAGALLLGLKNPGFVLALGLIYILCGWLLQSASQGSLLIQSTRGATAPMNALMYWLSTQPPAQLGHVFGVLLEIMLQVPALMVIAVLLVFGLYMFCTPDPGRPAWLRWIGAVHGVAHLALILLLTWAFAHLNASLGLQGPGHARLWAQGALYIIEMLAIGGPLGAFLFSLALLPGVNFNEAYSAQHIEHYKNFVRLKIDESGVLTVYPIGVDRVSRWVFNPKTNAREPYFRPRDGVPPKVRLIEEPFTVPAPDAVHPAAPDGLPSSAQAWNTSTQ
ncbi:MAG: hypothetical protein ABIU96_12365 [Rhodanobacter sp.]